MRSSYFTYFLLQKKRPSRISELETQVSQLQNELKKAKIQLDLSESLEKQAQLEAEDLKKQLLVLSQNSVDSAALASTMNEIQQLNVQLELVAKSEAEQTKQLELANAELQRLKGNLSETLSVVENMKNQLQDCKESEAQAQSMVTETLLQLEAAKKTVEVLRSDSMRAIEVCNSTASELDQSRARVKLLEGLVRELMTEIKNAGGDVSQNLSGDYNLELESVKNQGTGESREIKAELHSLKSEVACLRSALEIAESKYQEEQIQSTVQIRSAYELVEQVKAGSSLREAELEAEIKVTKADIEELKANLMDKETELQGILEENEGLNLMLKKSVSFQKEYDLGKELKKLNEDLSDLRANLMDKETELQSISEENETLKLEIKKREMDGDKVNDEVVSEVEAAKTAEREAIMKLGIVMEEADESKRRTARVTEQLEAAQSANSEMEAELRRLKVQSDQWRKAAEAAAAVLSAGNNGKFMERTGSLDSNYNPVGGKISSPYSENMDDDLLKKKNGNMLKKIGVLWKKPQK